MCRTGASRLAPYVWARSGTCSAAPVPVPVPPGQRLAAELERRRLSVRGLARQLAGNDDAKQVERERRMLNRLLHENQVSEVNARRVSAELGKSAGWLIVPKAETVSQLREERTSLRRRLRALERRVGQIERDREEIGAKATLWLQEHDDRLAALERVRGSRPASSGRAR